MIGERIKRARLGAGCSQEELARRAGISKMAVSKYETGKITPSSDRLISIGRALDVRVEYFLRATSIDLDRLKFRKRVSLSKKRQHQIEADVLEQVERFVELVELFPRRPCPEFELPHQLPGRIRHYEEIERVADLVRDVWRLGFDPIPSLVDTLENRGVLVMNIETAGPNGFDGLTAFAAEIPVIVIGADWPGDRHRFTLAHELGHLALEGRLDDDLDEERAAHRFAAAFLAPAEAVVCALGDRRSHIEPRELHELKHDFGLSMSGWLRRAFDLGIISDTKYVGYMKQFRRRRWHLNEPGDQYPAEEPQLFHRLVYRALAEDMISVSKAAELQGISISEFRAQRRMEVGGEAAHQ